jgi:predicted anti-sigma-YlaC factor YlaD
MEPDTPGEACEAVRATLSAWLDDEEGVLDAPAVAGHLDTCVACRAYADGIGRVQAAVAEHRSPEPPDLTELILQRAEPALRASARSAVLPWLRAALLFVACAMLAGAVPELVGPGVEAHDHTHHGTRHVGVFDAALAVGLLYVAWRPHRAMSMVPTSTAVAALMFLTAAADAGGDHWELLFQRAHLLEFAGAALCWLIAKPPRALQRTPAGVA